MKAILEIEMPYSCSECILERDTSTLCKAAGRDTIEDRHDRRHSRATFCPLKPITEEPSISEILEEVIDKVAAKKKGFNETALRDYFAGQYLSGIIAKHGDQISQFVAAKDAYLIADAMLKARGGDEDKKD